MRIGSLFFACGIMAGGHMLKHAMGPAKPFLLTHGWSDTAFGTLLSSSYWINMFFPLCAGIFLDIQGDARHGAVIATMMALGGHLLMCLCLSLGDHSGAIVGRALLGVGAGASGLVQAQIISASYVDHGFLASAVGVAESVKSISNWLGKVLPARLSLTFGGNWYQVLWSLSVAPALSVVISLCYHVWTVSHQGFRFRSAKAKNFPRAPSPLPSPRVYCEEDALAPASQLAIFGTVVVFETGTAEPEQGAGGGHSRSKSRTSSRVSLPSLSSDSEESFVESIASFDRRFWLLCALHLGFGNVYTLFGGVATDYLFGVERSIKGSDGSVVADQEQRTAAYLASLDSLIPIFASFAVGFAVDKTGGRLLYCAACSLLAMGAFSMFAMGFRPLFPMLILSLGGSVQTLIRSGIPLVVPRRRLGTALGIYGVFEAVGASFGNVVMGYLRYITKSYFADIAMLFTLATFTLAVSLALLCSDHDGALNSRKMH